MAFGRVDLANSSETAIFEPFAHRNRPIHATTSQRRLRQPLGVTPCSRRRHRVPGDLTGVADAKPRRPGYLDTRHHYWPRPDSASLAASRYRRVADRRPGLLGSWHGSTPGTCPRRRASSGRAHETLSIQPERRDVLRNPTREGILGELTRLSDALGPNDNLLIFYAGHGHWDQGSHQSYWLPKNARPANTALWVSNSDVEGTCGG